MQQSNPAFEGYEWVERIRQGDERAFEALFRTYCEDLCDVVLRQVHSPEVAEDLVHDIFCDLWDRRRRWDPKGPMKAYLYRAAYNKSLNWLKHHRVTRRRAAEEKHQERPSQESPEDAWRYRELDQAMQQAVEALPSRRRLVYQMARHQGMSYAEIAAALDISVKTVENQMGRALKLLRERLADFFLLLL